VSVPIHQTYDIDQLRQKLEEKMVLHGATVTSFQREEQEQWPSFHSTPSRDDEQEDGRSNGSNDSCADNRGVDVNSMGMNSHMNEDFAFRPGTPPLKGL